MYMFIKFLEIALGVLVKIVTEYIVKNTLVRNIIILLCIVVSATYVTASYVMYKYKKLHVQDVQEIFYENRIIGLIDDGLEECGNGTFSSWIRLSKQDNEYTLIFKEVRGLYGNMKSPNSVKGRNKLYDDIQVLDHNTRNELEKLPEHFIYNISKKTAEQNGYGIILKMFKEFKVPIDSLGVAIVKYNDNIIYVFTMSHIVGIKLKCEPQDVLLNITYNAKDLMFKNN